MQPNIYVTFFRFCERVGSRLPALFPSLARPATETERERDVAVNVGGWWPPDRTGCTNQELLLLVVKRNFIRRSLARSLPPFLAPSLTRNSLARCNLQAELGGHFSVRAGKRGAKGDCSKSKPETEKEREREGGERKREREREALNRVCVAFPRCFSRLGGQHLRLPHNLIDLGIVE